MYYKSEQNMLGGERALSATQKDPTHDMRFERNEFQRS